MRFIEIDGKRYDVAGCRDCPMFVNRMDEGLCAYPGHKRLFEVPGTGCKSDCPLRERPELAEGGVVDPCGIEMFFLSPLDSEKEIVIPEHILEVLGSLKVENEKPRRTMVMDDEQRVAMIECEVMEKTLSDMADLAENIEIAVENGELVMQGIFMERLKNRINACHNDMIRRQEAIKWDTLESIR